MKLLATFTILLLHISATLGVKIGLSSAQGSTSLDASTTPAKSIDNDFATSWKPAAGDVSASLQFDMGDFYKITLLKLVWVKNAYSTSFRIQVSVDGSSWTSVLTNPDAPSLSSDIGDSGVLEWHQHIVFDASIGDTVGRYIRFEDLSGSDSFAMIQFDPYGDISTLAPTPVPATIPTPAPVVVQTPDNPLPGDQTSGAGGIVTLAQKWNITDPGFSYDSLSFELDFTVSSYVKNTMSQYSLWETTSCQDGGDNTKMQQTEPLTTVKLEPTQYDSQSDGTDGFPLDRTMTLNITIDSEKITNSNIYNEYTIDSQLIAEVRFCVRFGLWTPQGTAPNFSDGVVTPLEVNFVETLVTLTVDLTDGFEIGSIAVEPKDRLVRTANQAYEVIGYECKVNAQDPAGDWVTLTDLEKSERRNQGQVVQVCVEPEQEAKDDGIFMRSVDNFFFSRDSANIRQDAIVNNNEATNLLTSYSSSGCVGATQCRFETILFAQFYTSLGVVNGEGVASMQFGSDNGRRNLRAGGREAQQDDAAGAAEFDLNFEVNLATTANSAASPISLIMRSAATAALLGAALF